MPDNAPAPGTYLTGSESGRNNPTEVTGQVARKDINKLARDVEPTGMKTVKANYEVQATDNVILVDARPGAVRILLPKAGDVLRRSITIKKIDGSGNAVTIEANRSVYGQELIDGAGTLALSAQYAAKQIYAAELGNWWITASV